MFNHNQLILTYALLIVCACMYKTLYVVLSYTVLCTDYYTIIIIIIYIIMLCIDYYMFCLRSKHVELLAGAIHAVYVQYMCTSHTLHVLHTCTLSASVIYQYVCSHVASMYESM